MRGLGVTSLIIVVVLPTGYLRHLSDVINTSVRTVDAADTQQRWYPIDIFVLVESDLWKSRTVRVYKHSTVTDDEM